MRNQNEQKFIWPNIPKYDEYGEYCEFCSKIDYEFRSNFNLPDDLNRKYTEHLHYIIVVQLF